MKYFLSFIFGAACGTVGTLIYLRKEIRKQMEEIKANSNGNAPESAGKGPNSNDTPFEVSEGPEEKNAVTVNSEAQKPIAVQDKTYVRYENLIRDNYGGELQNPSKSVTELEKREEGKTGVESVADGSGDILGKEFESRWIPIDDIEYRDNPEFNKEELTFFAEDRVLATKQGTVIENAYLLIGKDWEDEVGRYDDRTAYIRNLKTGNDYEIYVEYCCYADEYGVEGAPLVED